MIVIQGSLEIPISHATSENGSLMTFMKQFLKILLLVPSFYLNNIQQRNVNIKHLTCRFGMGLLLLHTMLQTYYTLLSLLLKISKFK